MWVNVCEIPAEPELGVMWGPVALSLHSFSRLCEMELVWSEFGLRKIQLFVLSVLEIGQIVIELLWYPFNKSYKVKKVLYLVF